MLVGISPLLSPELLDTLYRMGHGDEIVLADAHFPEIALAAVLYEPMVWKSLHFWAASILDQYVENPTAMMIGKRYTRPE